MARKVQQDQNMTPSGGGLYPQYQQDPQTAPSNYSTPGPKQGGDAANQPVIANGAPQPAPTQDPRQGAPMEGKFPNSFVNLQAYLYANPGASQDQLSSVMSPGSHSMAGVGPAAAPAQTPDQSPGGTLASGGGASGSNYGGTMNVPQQRSGLPIGTAGQAGQPQGAATGGQNMSTSNNVPGAGYMQQQQRQLFPRLASLLSQR